MPPCSGYAFSPDPLFQFLPVHVLPPNTKCKSSNYSILLEESEKTAGAELLSLGLIND
jgi:hypothetical protein